MTARPDDTQEVITQVLKKLGDGFDATTCSQCGEIIVVPDAEMEVPLCSRLECVARKFNVVDADSDFLDPEF